MKDPWPSILCTSAVRPVPAQLRRLAYQLTAQHPLRLSQDDALRAAVLRAARLTLALWCLQIWGRHRSPPGPLPGRRRPVDLCAAASAGVSPGALALPCWSICSGCWRASGELQPREGLGPAPAGQRCWQPLPGPRMGPGCVHPCLPKNPPPPLWDLRWPLSPERCVPVLWAPRCQPISLSRQTLEMAQLTWSSPCPNSPSPWEGSHVPIPAGVSSLLRPVSGQS